MDISENGKKIIKQFEGFRLVAYQDSIGIWTIGYGNITHKNGSRVKKGDKITIQQAEELFDLKIKDYVDAINKNVTVKINQNQFDSLVSFCYNVGIGNLEKSTLLKLVNKEKYDDAANEFLKWNKAGGKVIEGLTNRRKKERDLFLK